MKHYCSATLIFLCMGFLMGCGQSRDGQFIGHWEATKTQINRWDSSDITPGDEKTLILYEDGMGSLKQGNVTDEIRWHNDSHNLYLKAKSGWDSVHAYTFKDNKMTLDFPREDMTYVFDRKADSY